MDIDKYSFPSRLLDVLEAIAESHFVSFDLELSGVPVKGQAKGKPGKPSLQDRYLETKNAAEQYQILQIGLTCVKDHVLQSAYVCKPFNFNLSPIVEERLHVDRIFSFHSGAAEFLLGVGFKFDLPFTSGVPYLSRDEARLAGERAAARNDKSSFTDIEIKPEDVQALEFLRRIRFQVDAWLDTGMPNAHSLVIGPLESDGEDELNRFERRLVHQIIRAEYPDLVTIPNRGLVRVSRLDPEREEYIKAQRKREVQERIARQTGFRWIVEALCGNPPEAIDVKSFALTPGGVLGFVDLDHLKSRFSRVKHMLRNKKTALFGHNLFLDLIYFYRTFIGALPDTVDEFAILIHELFPIIVDTKYMATHNCGDINPQSSLEQIAEKLAEQEKPRVTTHEEYKKYSNTTAFHEAGYDSMLTAEVAVRLSAKLDLAGSHDQDEKQNTIPPTPPDVDVGGVRLDGITTNTPSVIESAIDSVKGLLQAPFKVLGGQKKSSDEKISKRAEQSHSGPTPKHLLSEQLAELSIAENETGSTGNKSKKKKKKKNRKSKTELSNATSAANQGGHFAHTTAFDRLQDMLEVSEEEETTSEEVLEFDALPSESAHLSDPVATDTDGVSDPHITATWDSVPTEVTEVDSDAWKPREVEVGTVMPDFSSDFWKLYGNKLRVFGTQEGVAVLG